MTYYDTFKNNWVIAAIVVDPERRKQGLATEAMKDVISIARELKADKLALEATPMGRKFSSKMAREDLKDWYERLGFSDQEKGSDPKEHCSGVIMEMKP